MIDVVMGCQYGSEGKGLIADVIASSFGQKYDWLVSVNSAQAGHTTYYRFGQEISDKMEKVVTRQLPSSCINEHDAKIYIGAGALINPFVLDKEIEMLEDLGIPIKNRLYISKQATIISQTNIIEEEQAGLQKKVGSTCEGVGSAQKDRVMRTAMTVGEFYGVYQPELCKFNMVNIFDLPELLWYETKILLEGSQGYHLSLYDENYPYTTSRPISVAAFLSYAELPLHVNNVYGVFRTFPIRVGGNSGYLPNEISWEEVSKISGYEDLAEYTTVTGRLRRIAHFNSENARKAIILNKVTHPILTFVNYYDRTIEECTKYEDLTDKVKNQIRILEDEICNEFYMLSTSRYGHHILRY